LTPHLSTLSLHDALPIYSGKANALAMVREMTNGRGSDLSFEAVGVSATVDLSLQCLRKGGTAVLVGNVAPKIEFPLQVAVTRELDRKSTRLNSSHRTISY